MYFHGNNSTEETKKEKKNIMEKRFHVPSPKELRALADFIKEGEIENAATVWSAKLRKAGSSPWDSSIYAVFYGGRNRSANVVRFGEKGRQMTFAKLKYNMALKWCEENLTQEGADPQK